MGNLKNDKDKLKMLVELEGYEEKGVSLWLDNIRSTPEAVVNACFLREEANYMRDYVSDEDGVISEIRFDKVTNK